MPHPKMFDDDDPLFLRVRAIALALPGAGMKVSHGRPAFYTTKVFAYYGGSLKQDGAWVSHPHAIMVYGDLERQTAYRDRDDAWIPAYLGGYGWTGIDVGQHTDWVEIGDLIEDSYRLTAPGRLVAALDRGGGTA